MEILNFEQIDQRWHEMEALELDSIPEIIDSLGKFQPYILAYLMATGNEILDQNEREALLFMGVMIWHIVSSATPDIPEVSGELLDEKELKNISMLEYLSGEPEPEFMDTVDKIIGNYHQSELLKYMIDRLMEEPEKGVTISENNVGMIVIYLKTIIDCLDSEL